MKQNMFIYRVAQAASFLVAKLIFNRQVIRNEIKGKKGPFVIIANHQCALDFVSLISLTKTPMSFVISNAFYNSLPIKGLLDRMGLIPKQQFQTTVKDMKNMKAVIEKGNPLVIYPAGLMCEDGISTPIPEATYKFLKWLGVDVYVAKVSGTYFSMPKWAKGFRPGKTFIDVYKLFSKEELLGSDVDEIKNRAEAALVFDAYKEQETLRVRFKNNKISGLESVLYMCPHCLREFEMWVRDKNVIGCKHCGFEQVSDEFSFLHNHKGIGNEIRYVSDWSRKIFTQLKEKIETGQLRDLSAKTTIMVIDSKKHKFVTVGQGTVTLNEKGFIIDGKINDEKSVIEVSTANFPTLPFSPGKYFEIQQGKNIYRCCLEDGKLVMKFINMVKAFYLLKKQKVGANL